MELKLLGAICCELLFFLEKIFLPRASVKKGKRGVNIYIFNNMNMRIQEEERSEILRNKENQFDWDSDSGNLFCCFVVIIIIIIVDLFRYSYSNKYEEEV